MIDARFPNVPEDAGHYESYYLKACHPEQPLGVWIRYTIHKAPGAAPKGSLWCTLFEPDGPRAAKVTTGEVGAGGEDFIRVGDARFGLGHVVGEALDASWELTFDPGTERPFHHLPRGWMYKAKIPRTKTLSPYPAARFSGRVRHGDREVELDGWPGMIGHNWGAEHAERWIWMHGTAFDGHEDAYLDAAIGRIAVGPVTTPWIGNGVLVLDGRRHRLGGIERARKTHVEERPEGCEFSLAGKGVTVRGRVGASRDRFVGWVYADPDGPQHHTVNCSIADMTLTVERRRGPDVELRVAGGATYELGMRERDHGIPIQPFPDG